MKKLFVIFAILALSGCVSYSKSVPLSETASTENAYIYGVFSIKAPKAWLAMKGHQSMAFVLTCADKKKYTIGFRIEKPLQVVKVSPAKCSLTEIIFADADGLILSSKPVPAGMFTDKTFAAGKAYYLGDYFAVSENTMSYPYISTTWRIVDTKNNYIQTTQDMYSAYPNFRNFATVPLPVLPSSEWR